MNDIGGNQDLKEALVTRLLRALRYRWTRPSLNVGIPEHEKNERMMARWTRQVGIFTMLLFATAAGSAGILYWQLQAMQGQLDEMKSTAKQTDKLIEANQGLADAAMRQAEASVRQSEAAVKQATAAADSVKIARDSLIAGQRAWIGPTNASIVGSLQVNETIKVQLAYGNTGRQAALTNAVSSIKVFSIEDWNNGYAANQLHEFQKACMTSELVEPLAMVVYPTTGFMGYSQIIDTNSKNNPEQHRFTASEKLIAGDEIFTLRGCFVYRTVESIMRDCAKCRHSSHGEVRCADLGTKRPSAGG